ncbi:uncharacterized protein F4812DRAFT_19715 [Daldinia caldariorum]|uniref:uncharacterized protein n=1 Tax=Daldinia caldariorum TaxID=326644 RepID=UPI002007C005|nr:uncharacterized protein F4812DRAFT_19715 [Daldinia caldariorum]KAI1472627.1 hypothetical protein F4812DRAFT_19715 [Daldinia caldariorum]
MPATPLTSAGRLVADPDFKSGWGAVLTPEINEVVRSVRKEAGATYRLQTARDEPITVASMYTALFWEARNFRNSSTVFIPAITEEFKLFAEEDEVFDASRAVIRKKASENIRDTEFHPLLKSIRDSKFTLWPVRLPLEDIWVTIALQLGGISEGSKGSQGSPLHYDREVVACAIIDPYPSARDDRRNFVKKRLAEILGEGCIRFNDGVVMGTFTTEDISKLWETGHVAYAICREFIRRLNVLKYQEDCGHSVSTSLLWSPFEQHHDVDSYRESIMAACAHRTIQNSNYLVRMALEVPSKKSNHEPGRLDPHVEDLKDSWFTKPKTKTPRKAEVEVPEQDNIVVAPLTPVSEHGSRVSQSNNQNEYDDDDDDDVDEEEEEDDEEEDADADADADENIHTDLVSQGGAYTPSSPVLNEDEKPVGDQIIQSIEEPHDSHEEVSTEVSQDLQEQDDTPPEGDTKEQPREVTPAKRERDDEEGPPTKRTKLEDTE